MKCHYGSLFFAHFKSCRNSYIIETFCTFRKFNLQKTFAEFQFVHFRNLCRFFLRFLQKFSAIFIFSTNSNCRIFFHNLGLVEFAKVKSKFAEFGGTALELPQFSSFAQHKSKKNEVKHQINPCRSGCISANTEKRSAFQQGEEVLHLDGGRPHPAPHRMQGQGGLGFLLRNDPKSVSGCLRHFENIS